MADQALEQQINSALKEPAGEIPPEQQQVPEGQLDWYKRDVEGTTEDPALAPPAPPPPPEDKWAGHKSAEDLVVGHKNLEKHLKQVEEDNAALRQQTQQLMNYLQNMAPQQATPPPAREQDSFDERAFAQKIEENPQAAILDVLNYNRRLHQRLAETENKFANIEKMERTRSVIEAANYVNAKYGDLEQYQEDISVIAKEPYYEAMLRSTPAEALPGLVEMLYSTAKNRRLWSGELVKREQDAKEKGMKEAAAIYQKQQQAVTLSPSSPTTNQPTTTLTPEEKIKQGIMNAGNPPPGVNPKEGRFFRQGF